MSIKCNLASFSTGKNKTFIQMLTHGCMIFVYGLGGNSCSKQMSFFTSSGCFIRAQKQNHKRRNRTVMMEADTHTACGLYLSVSHKNTSVHTLPSSLGLPPSHPRKSNIHTHLQTPPLLLPSIFCSCADTVH